LIEGTMLVGLHTTWSAPKPKILATPLKTGRITLLSVRLSVRRSVRLSLGLSRTAS